MEGKNEWMETNNLHIYIKISCQMVPGVTIPLSSMSSVWKMIAKSLGSPITCSAMASSGKETLEIEGKMKTRKAFQQKTLMNLSSNYDLYFLSPCFYHYMV